ncbi:MAG: hypothetical protein IT440_09505 [Phycisphaeraceae bacterium]|nr:hypothetical protein [Phycisphaeraceae bacterium]
MDTQGRGIAPADARRHPTWTRRRIVAAYAALGALACAMVLWVDRDVMGDQRQQLERSTVEARHAY